MHSKRIQEKVKKDYDQIAKEFSDTRTHPWKEFNQFKAYLEDGQTVYDFGCGNGRLLSFLKEEGNFNYTGVDQSKALLEQARKQHPKAKFIEADISRELELDKADIIFAIASFHHIPPKDQANTLQNWRELLKEDGILIMTNWNLFQKRFWKAWLNFKRPSFFGLLIPWKNTVMRYYYAFTHRKLNRLLKKSGYQLIHIECGMNILTIAKHADS